MPLTLSIVITNHNYARFLGAAIDSALDQNGAEVVVVDDGSTDDSRSIIERYGRRVTAVFTPNAGQGGAFNSGFAEAHGDVVIFLDADDVLWPGSGERVVAAMAADPSIVRVQFPLDVIDRVGRPTGSVLPGPPKVLFEGDAVPRLLTCPDDIVWQPTTGNAFRRTTLAAVLPMPEMPYRLCADYYLSNLVPLHGPVGVLEASGGGYRVHGTNGYYARGDRPDRLRANIRRTQVTHEHLIEESRRLGLTGLPSDPAAVRSVSSVANRLLSYRIDAAHHPLPGDTRFGLVKLGISSALARTDVSAVRRAAFVCWFLAMAVVPRWLVGAVARPFTELA